MASLDSFNPMTGELLGSVATVDPEDVQAAVEEVAAVQPFWGELSLPDRGRYLRRTAEAGHHPALDRLAARLIEHGLILDEDAATVLDRVWPGGI